MANDDDLKDFDNDENVEEEGSPVMPDGTDDNTNPSAPPEGEDPDGM